MTDLVTTEEVAERECVTCGVVFTPPPRHPGWRQCSRCHSEARLTRARQEGYQDGFAAGVEATVAKLWAKRLQHKAANGSAGK